MALHGQKSELEQWLPVGDYEGIYSVSNLGRVRSEDREVVNHPSGSTRKVRGQILKARPDGGGYLTVWLSKEHVQRAQKVAVLVAHAFVGPNPGGLDVCHGDGDKTNNAAGNLRYDTRKGNMADTERHGTKIQGEKQHCAKLTAVKVKSIRKDARKYEDIAADLGVSIATVGSVKTFKSWKHVA